MAIDRIAKWGARKPKRPKQQIGETLRRYLGEAATSIECNAKSIRWVAWLHGRDNHPFPIPGRKDLEGDYRGFEVCVDDEGIDVITRQADEYTNAVADGFFEAVVRYWGMEKEGVS
jgi:hypothetical protein